MTAPIGSVRDLTVDFVGAEQRTPVVRGVSFDLYPGEILGIVGESGSGKTVTALSMMGLLPDTARVGGSITIGDTEVVGAEEETVRKLRGRDIGMVFQDPMTTLNPVKRVGGQVTESLVVHGLAPKSQMNERAVSLLRDVQIPDPETRVRRYPHEFSGGMRQRAVIAMAIAGSPGIIIADEPTTALDVTVQAEVLDVLKEVQASTGSGVLLITHDLGVIAEVADRVIVMYAGRVVDSGTVMQVFSEPAHPYTIGLMASRPRLETSDERLIPVPGQPPSPESLPSGCPFQPRCFVGREREICYQAEPPLVSIGVGREVACHFAAEVAEIDSPEADIAAEGNG